MNRPAPNIVTPFEAPPVTVGTDVMDELRRILALPRRDVVDCEREPGTRRWAPATQALVEVITERYTRGKRLSCACQDRVVESLGGGRIVVYRTGLPNRAPPLPLETTVDEFCSDNAHDIETITLVSGIRRGQKLDLNGLGAPFCLVEFNPFQAWTLYELPITRGVTGFVSVGGGKCLTAGNEVFDLSAARRRDVSESGELAVPSLLDGTIVQRTASSFRSGWKICRRVVLADGTCVTASDDHPIYTSSGWVDAGHLVVGSFVAVACYIPEPTQPTQVNDDELKLIAYLLADGSCNRVNACRFTNETPPVLDEFQRLADTVCAGWGEVESRSNARELTLKGARSFRDRWNLYGLARDKRLHPSLWGLSRRQVALFLNRFWACDGYVVDRTVEITLASEKMIDDLQFLLLRLGIRARKHYKESRCDGSVFDSWRLSVRSSDALCFLDEVGDVLGKEPACHRLRNTLSRLKRNTNVDVVPIGEVEFKIICDELGFAANGAARRSGNGRPRTDLRKKFSITQGQYLSRNRFIELCKNTGYRGRFFHLASEHLRWERVVETSSVGEQAVYDLSVPETHNFVVNGMVVHNTIAGIMAPLAVPDRRTWGLFAKPDQRIHYQKAYLRLREHFRVPSMVFDQGMGGSYSVDGVPTVRFIPYSVLSNPKSTTLLESYNFDAAVADESHLVANRTSSRTMRLLRFMAKREKETNGRFVFVDWSGSKIKRSMKDTTHLAAHALGMGSPYPLLPKNVEAFAKVIDPSHSPDTDSAVANALKQAFGVKTELQRAFFISAYVDNDDVLNGYREHILRTPGVISTKSSSVTCSISVRMRKAPPIPTEVKEALTKVRSGFRPDGDELVDAAEVAMCARAVACGFYHYWAFPKHPCTCVFNNEGFALERCSECLLIDEWYARRKAFNKELRMKVLNGEPYLDSRKLCEEAAMRAYQDPPYSGELPMWPSIMWPSWHAIENKVNYEEKIKWIGSKENPDDPVGWYLAKDAAEWAKESCGIVWVQTPALGKLIAKFAGINYHGGGPDAEVKIHAEDGKRSIVASIKAHGTGRDELQFKFHKQLEVEPLASGDMYEQFFGRLAREGQPEDTIETDLYRHVYEFRDAWRKAKMLAQFIEAKTGNRQLMLAADESFDEDDD